MKESGIYCIKNTFNNKVYVGSSFQLRKRIASHLRRLKGNYHENKKLQNAWNKYGAKVFIIFILEYVSQKFLLEKEQNWIQKLDSFKNGYNQTPFATITTQYCKKIKLISPIGEVIEGKSLVEVANKTGLSSAAISQLGLGKYKSAKGYRLYSKDLVGQNFQHKDNWKNMIKRNSKRFSLINSDGAIICGNNMSEFCRQNNLSVCGISSLMTGRLAHYKGYKKFVESK